jgi:hypothetical protein
MAERRRMCVMLLAVECLALPGCLPGLRHGGGGEDLRVMLLAGKGLILASSSLPSLIHGGRGGGGGHVDGLVAIRGGRLLVRIVGDIGEAEAQQRMALDHEEGNDILDGVQVLAKRLPCDISANEKRRQQGEKGHVYVCVWVCGCGCMCGCM